VDLQQRAVEAVLHPAARSLAQSEGRAQVPDASYGRGDGTVSNLIEGIQEQQKRFREELIPAYESIGLAGQFALQLTLRPLLAESEKALASGDVVQMLSVCKQMQDCE
jgi:hypothetical protein